MKLTARISVGAATLLVLASTVGCAKLKARDQLVKGVQSFKAGRFEDAVNHFQTSISLDPTYDIARLDLAAAYSSQVVPNLDSPENLKVAHQALDQFNQVLEKNPHDVVALRQVASIHRSIKMYDQARKDELKVIAEAPNDDQAFYTIGHSPTRMRRPSSAQPALPTTATVTRRSPRKSVPSSSKPTQALLKLQPKISPRLSASTQTTTMPCSI